MATTRVPQRTVTSTPRVPTLTGSARPAAIARDRGTGSVTGTGSNVVVVGRRATPPPLTVRRGGPSGFSPQPISTTVSTRQNRPSAAVALPQNRQLASPTGIPAALSRSISRSVAIPAAPNRQFAPVGAMTAPRSAELRRPVATAPDVQNRTISPSAMVENQPSRAAVPSSRLQVAHGVTREVTPVTSNLPTGRRVPTPSAVSRSDRMAARVPVSGVNAPERRLSPETTSVGSASERRVAMPVSSTVSSRRVAEPSRVTEAGSRVAGQPTRMSQSVSRPVGGPAEVTPLMSRQFTAPVQMDYQAMDYQFPPPRYPSRPLTESDVR